jgi:glutamate synthase (NADPH/NADH) small chain
MATILKEIQNGRHELTPEVKIIAERCVGCQECIMRCPTQALSLNKINWVAVADNSLCVGCRQCERTCPLSAIRVEGPRLEGRRADLIARAGLSVLGDTREVKPGFTTLADAIKEAERCLNCPDPTCMRGCPAHNDIPGFIEAIRNRDLALAQQILARTSCLPDVCSRVCNWAAQCEGACSWALAGGHPVAIGKLERFVTDHSPIPALEQSSDLGQGLSIGVVGAGPAGIAAAWELASAGAQVTVYDSAGTPGGVMGWGIPLHVLPDEVARRPVRALVEGGVIFRLNTRISPENIDKLLSSHQAVVAAVGAGVPDRPRIPGVDLKGVEDATHFLTRAREALVRKTGFEEVKGQRILVLGGSNTAIDVARSIVRLGGEAVVIHREEERFSFGRPDEIAEAKGEGVVFHFATNVAGLAGEDGKLKTALLVRTNQTRADRVPTAIRGTEWTMDVRMVVIAIGYKLDSAFSSQFTHLPVRQPVSDRLFPDRRWVGSGIMAGDSEIGRLAWQREFGLRTAAYPRRPNVWLVGDLLSGPSSVVASMAQGKAAARSILENRGVERIGVNN